MTQISQNNRGGVTTVNQSGGRQLLTLMSTSRNIPVHPRLTTERRYHCLFGTLLGSSTQPLKRVHTRTSSPNVATAACCTLYMEPAYSPPVSPPNRQTSKTMLVVCYLQLAYSPSNGCTPAPNNRAALPLPVRYALGTAWRLSNTTDFTKLTEGIRVHTGTNHIAWSGRQRDPVLGTKRSINTNTNKRPLLLIIQLPHNIIR